MTGRVGIGFDIHHFSDDPARRLILGGIVLEGERALAGHSDGDVIAHAVADALLGAACLGDLGEYFPETEERWRGADSIDLLTESVALVHRAGWSVVNVDCSVVLEAPRLKPHRQRMMDRLSEVVSAPVSVKAKRAEGLGALGRREGIACWAVALLDDAR